MALQSRKGVLPGANACRGPSARPEPSAACRYLPARRESARGAKACQPLGPGRLSVGSMAVLVNAHERQDEWGTEMGAIADSVTGS